MRFTTTVSRQLKSIPLWSAMAIIISAAIERM